MSPPSPQPLATTCIMSGFYMSACCRSEIYLDSGQAHPPCPRCGKSAEWFVLARPGGDPRRYPRHGEGNRTLFASYAVLNGNRADNVRILNFSRRGMAIELPSPAPVSAEARLRIDGFSEAVVGVIRHSTSRPPTYVAGLEILGEWSHGLLQKRLDRHE